MILRRGDQSADEARLPGSARVRLVAPWREALAACRAALAAHAGQRLFLECACCFADGVWYDGPLAHVLPDGRVASFVPSGGPAELFVPDGLTAEIRGVPWDDAAALEGPAPARQLRCLTAELDARLPAGPLVFALAAGDLRAACILTVIRKVRYEERLAVALAAPPSPAFRRFAQNTGFFLVSDAGGLPLADYMTAVNDDETAPLARELNRLSAVIPAGLCRDPSLSMVRCRLK